MFFVAECANAAPYRSAISPNDEPPEPDALTKIDFFSGQFSPSLPSGFLTYSPNISLISGRSDSENLRAIGAATLLFQTPGRLLDGLSANLLRQLVRSMSFSETPFGELSPARNMLGRRGFSEIFSPDELFERMANPSFWEPRRLVDKSANKGFDLSFRVAGKTEVLRVLGRASFVSSSPVWVLQGVDPRLKLKTAEAKEFAAGLDGIIDDFNSRSALAETYSKAPHARGLPPELRAQIKMTLELAGVPNGSYSRVGFSSGVFPYGVTEVPVLGSHKVLHFERCRSCGSVKELSIHYQTSGDHVGSSQGPMAGLTERHIGPWHRSICSGPEQTTRDSVG